MNEWTVAIGLGCIEALLVLYGIHVGLWRWVFFMEEED